MAISKKPSDAIRDRFREVMPIGEGRTAAPDFDATAARLNELDEAIGDLQMAGTIAANRERSLKRERQKLIEIWETSVLFRASELRNASSRCGCKDGCRCLECPACKLKRSDDGEPLQGGQGRDTGPLMPSLEPRSNLLRVEAHVAAKANMRDSVGPSLA